MTQNSERTLSFIATRELTGIDPTGREFPIKLAIGSPYQEGTDWRCPVLLDDFSPFSRVSLASIPFKPSCSRSAWPDSI